MRTAIHIYKVPVYDERKRVFHLGGQVIKHFKQPAGDQEAVLLAFEEEGWPDRIEDPLRPCSGQDVKRRLRTTIDNLNRNQQHQLVRFGGDGTGEGIVWKLLETDAGGSENTSQG